MLKLSVFAVTVAIGASTSVLAQVNLDVAKINCEQFIGFKISGPDKIAIWLSGYYHGKRGDTVLDMQALDANARKLTVYCIKNPKITVMDAIEKIFVSDNH